MDTMTDAVDRALSTDPELPGELERHADLHRRAIATYVDRASAAERAGRERQAALEGERRAARKAYDAELARIHAAMGDAQEATANEVARALRLAETSRVALAVLEREG